MPSRSSRYDHRPATPLRLGADPTSVTLFGGAVSVNGGGIPIAPSIPIPEAALPRERWDELWKMPRQRSDDEDSR